MTDKILASSAETSPEVLLKQAILGARASAEKADKPSAPAGRSLPSFSLLASLLRFFARSARPPQLVRARACSAPRATVELAAQV